MTYTKQKPAQKQYRAIRTVTQAVWTKVWTDQVPDRKIGDYACIYAGPHENCYAYIRDIRWNHDRRCFEYFLPSYGWFATTWLH